MLGDPNYGALHKCVSMDCRTRALCEMPKGELEAKEFLKGQAHDSVECDHFYPVADLRGENLRDNPKLHKQFSPGTRRIRRRGGEWVAG